MPAYFESGLMVGKSAWHSRGKVIPADDDRRFSIRDCIKLSEMDWTVERGECFYVHGDEVDVIPDKYALLRRNKDGSIRPLSVVGSKYCVLQNDAAFGFFQPWLDTKEVSIETAGSLKDGAVVWVLAKILRGDVEFGGESVAKYLMLSTTHDGTEATRVGFTPIRVVCWNTLSMAHSTSASRLLKVRHTASQQQTLATIRETIDLVDQQFVATGAQYARMMSCGLSLAELRRYVKVVLDVDPEVREKDLGTRTRNRIDLIVALALGGIGQSGEMTAWSAYNGVTEYVTHHAGTDSEKRLSSNMGGAYASMNRRAFDLAVQLAA